MLEVRHLIPALNWAACSFNAAVFANRSELVVRNELTNGAGHYTIRLATRWSMCRVPVRRKEYRRSPIPLAKRFQPVPLAAAIK